MPNKEDLNSAAQTIFEFIKSAEQVEEFIEKEEEIEKIRKDEDSKEDYSRRMLQFVKAKRKSGGLSFPNYIFRAAFYVIEIHENRWLNHQYDEELNPISQKMKEIEKENGLKEDEYWPLDEGPDEWRELNNEYNRVLYQKLSKVFKEIGFEDIADLIKKDKAKYDKLYEEGRKNTFNETSEIEKLSAIIDKYKREAQISIESKAYYASAILSGAAIEALLLREVLKKPEQVSEVIDSLPQKNKPKSDPKKWRLYDLINIAERADWLPKIQIKDDIFLLDALAHVVRALRNFLHPGRVLREKATIGIEKSEAELANSVLVVLNYAIEHINKKVEEA